jgi:hypothetical protein
MLSLPAILRRPHHPGLPHLWLSAPARGQLGCTDIVISAGPGRFGEIPNKPSPASSRRRPEAGQEFGQPSCMSPHSIKTFGMVARLSIMA